MASMTTRRNGRLILLPGGNKYPTDFREARSQFERRYIRKSLIVQKGNISKTAKMMHIARRNLQLKIKAFDIDVDEIKETHSAHFAG